MIIQSVILPPQGFCNAIIRCFEPGPYVDTPYSSNEPTVIITYELPEYGQRITQRYIARVSSNSEIGKVFFNILGQIPEPADTDLLVDEHCQVELEHRISKTTGNVFANVVNVRALNEGLDLDLVERSIDDQDLDVQSYDHEYDFSSKEQALLKEHENY